MKRIGAEIRYDNAYSTALAEMELVSKKATKERIDSIKELLKEMDKCITKIEQDFYGNPKINKKDAENKVNSYRDQYKTLKQELLAAELTFQHKELIKRPPASSEPTTEDKLSKENREMA
jgi:archaellum component FlaC